VAQTLAHACPSELGREILLLGATARGQADQYDGVELRFYVDGLQDPDPYLLWLLEQGVKLDPLSPQVGIGLHAKGAFQELFLEVSWLPLESLEWSLRPILTGQQTEHWALVETWQLATSVGMNSAPNVAFFKTLLQHYPSALQEALIESVLSVWAEPHWYPQSLIQLWPLAERGTIYALHQRLQREVERALRLIFAANRAYEPDYRWLASEVKRLERLPNQLVDRIEGVLTLRDGKRSVYHCVELLLDCLPLLPPEIDCIPAQTRLQEALNLMVFLK
jgi:hypothetical protein